MADRPSVYPPPIHFLSDLDIATEHVALDHTVATVAVDEFVRNRAGAASLGFVVAVVDVCAAMVALSAAHPNWTATADLSLHSTDWLLDGPMRIDSHLIRRGSHIVVIGSDVFDGGGRRMATGTLSFASIPRAASAAARDFVPGELVGQQRRMRPGAPPRPVPLAERVSLREIGPGVVEIPKDDYVINSFGTINGGVLGALFQYAAESLVDDLVATDLQIHYLRQAGAGPARTTTTLLRRAEDHAVCAIEAVDAGDGDRVLALATVTLQRAPQLA